MSEEHINIFRDEFEEVTLYLKGEEVDEGEISYWYEGEIYDGELDPFRIKIDLNECTIEVNTEAISYLVISELFAFMSDKILEKASELIAKKDEHPDYQYPDLLIFSPG